MKVQLNLLVEGLQPRTACCLNFDLSTATRVYKLFLAQLNNYSIALFKKNLGSGSVLRRVDFSHLPSGESRRQTLGSYFQQIKSVY